MLIAQHARQIHRSISLLVILTIVPAVSVLLSCGTSRTVSGEILIGLDPDAIPFLSLPGEIDPLHTGITSLDSLNRRYCVQQMIPVFPDVPPDDSVAVRLGLAGVFRLVVPSDTNLEAMLQDYLSDPHVKFAELNQIYQVE